MSRSTNLLKTDCDGNWYSIPEGQVDHFVNLVEAIQNADFMSAEWHSAVDELSSQFGNCLKDTVTTP